MAGGAMRYRTLGRSSAHRQALLRNLVTSLIKQEQIHTTWHKAKEAQRLAEHVITLAKKNTESSKRDAMAILYSPHEHIDKLMNDLRARYQNREGGYTRVLRTEPKNKYDQGESAILELVDGPKDMLYAITAAAVARDRALGRPHTSLLLHNLAKVTRFRGDNAKADFEAMVERMAALELSKARKAEPLTKMSLSDSSEPRPSAYSVVPRVEKTWR
ncbi:hypothetical protein MCOR27_002805 [Pyricularia oryzae]|uniref:50S ribosomal protein L17 n=2 Tax=Pyricularia TaxID=48558 RepID=A0ABQ8NKZ6_PYRGI|nr:hypothetical protein MCOR01_005761 [Pyricularia oryzae]KAI6298740.1 hypothetical protein MCOR33_005188 [Pyricularia grisea]KAI6261739.1 hypothetical protein MCOR19_001954 [Pyricularia oryzae]KAI6281176.1 hypothetical protein MCOR26_003368 [Pyricularia oryzae]KAI6284450.1 hypothetical protein MCOR27_002805 [Pyricularia oryzae]